jgi:hypothetical protein
MKQGGFNNIGPKKRFNTNFVTVLQKTPKIVQSERKETRFYETVQNVSKVVDTFVCTPSPSLLCYIDELDPIIDLMSPITPQFESNCFDSICDSVPIALICIILQPSVVI